jgi:hypothetical protein
MPMTDFSGVRSATLRLQFDCGGHGDSKPADFFTPLCSPTGEAGKNAATGFMRCSPNCHSAENNEWQRIKFGFIK